MRYRLIGCRAGRTCPCGALAKDGADTCEKCARRARWSRRKEDRAFSEY